ncbi:MAG: hypothetical protein V1890_03445, partial [Candidatus Zixiibacteriota bacterium]
MADSLRMTEKGRPTGGGKLRPYATSFSFTVMLSETKHLNLEAIRFFPRQRRGQNDRLIV